MNKNYFYQPCNAINPFPGTNGNSAKVDWDVPNGNSFTIYKFLKFLTWFMLRVKNDHRSKFSNLSNWKEEAWKKLRASTGFEPVTSVLPVRCSTNRAMKPHIGSEVNLLSSYLPWGVKWYEVYEILRLWMRVKNDHRSKLSNLSNWKEEGWFML